MQGHAPRPHGAPLDGLRDLRINMFALSKTQRSIRRPGVPIGRLGRPTEIRLPCCTRENVHRFALVAGRARRPPFSNANFLGSVSGEAHCYLEGNEERVYYHPGQLAASTTYIVVFVCMLLLAWGLAPRVAGAQHAAVEWLEFDCEGEQCLILNAYSLRGPEPSDTGEPYEREPLTPEEVAPILLRLPVTAVPDSNALDAFCRILGAPDLKTLMSSTPQLTSENTSNLVVWKAFVRALREQAEVQVGAGTVRSVEVSDILKRVYDAQGYFPSGQRLLPHLVRGVLAVVDREGSVVDTGRAVDLGAVEYGVPQYALVTFANLGSSPLRVYSKKEFFSGASLSSAEFSLLPGERKGRLLRHDADLVSLLTGRSRSVVAYESEGERHVVLELRGQISSPGHFLASTARSQLADHRGYWRDLPLYRFALLAIAIGLVALLVAARALAVSSAAACLRRTRLSLFWLSRIFSRGVKVAARSVRQTAARSAFLKRAADGSADRQRGASRMLSSAVARLKLPAGPHLSRTMSRIPYTITGPISWTKARLVAGWKSKRDPEPVSARMCVERIEELCEATRHPDAPPLHAKRIRRESIMLARRLDDDLRRGRLSPAIEHFQILWSLRLLSDVMARKDIDAKDVLDQWILGAQKVLTHRCSEVVGPATLEFMGLVQVLSE